MNDMSSVAGRDHLQHARALAPHIAAAAAGMERQRCLTPAILAALIEGGFYRMLQPKFLGGAELPLPLFMEVVEEIAKADASTAWCVTQCCVCSMAAAYLDRETAIEIFGDPDGIVAWGPPAPSQARVVDGGYRVSGTWNFASGRHQAGWLGGQSYVFERDGMQRRNPDGSPVVRMMLFPHEAARITDVWDVIGLSGTGSDTYSVEDLFVPERRAFGRDEPAERRENGLLFKFSGSNVFAFGFAAVALGIARSALDAAIAVAREKFPYNSSRAMGDNNVVQAQIGRAEAKLRSSRAYLYGTARDMSHALAAVPTLSGEQKVDVRLASTSTIHSAADVVDIAYRMVGSTAIFASNPFERRFRDMHTVTQQLQGRESHYEIVGQVLLGLKPDALMFST
jgi:alkylation response protein AidB-like acyl-CoA dehydrogenase